MRNLSTLFITAGVVLCIALAAIVSVDDHADRRCEYKFAYIEAVNDCLDYDEDKCSIGPPELVKYKLAQNYVREFCSPNRRGS